MKEATMLVRTADTIHFPNTILYPGSYPSEFSDLAIQLTLMNTTVISHDTIVDGSYLAGDMLFQISSHPHYTWSLFVDWIFRHFSKPIATRQYTWSSGPYLIFRHCIFEDSDSDLFIMSGGTIIFEDCTFRNISGRVLKALDELNSEFVDCLFEDCNAFFIQNSDASFLNCVFRFMKGQRGGAIYSSKSTLTVHHCIFVGCQADINGGSIYVRNSKESFESSITQNAFLQSSAGTNGSAIFSYLSFIDIEDNCFDLPDSSIDSTGSSLKLNNNTFNSKCSDYLKRPPASYIKDDYTPVDTFQWTSLDNLKPGTIIQVSDGEDDDFDVFADEI